MIHWLVSKPLLSQILLVPLRPGFDGVLHPAPAGLEAHPQAAREHEHRGPRRAPRDAEGGGEASTS
jgi:hypothetical protein